MRVVQLCLRNRMLYLPIKTRSMRDCPLGVCPGLCLNLKQPSPEDYSCNSPYSCSLKPQASFTQTVVSVVSVVFVVLKISSSQAHRAIRAIRAIRVRLNPKQQSRVRLLIRVIRVIRVRHLQHSSPQAIRSVQPIKH